MDPNNNRCAEFSFSDKIASLVGSISKLGKNIELDDAKTRKALIAAARSLSLALETPMEALLRMYWAEVS